MALQTHGPAWFRRVPSTSWANDSFHTSVRLSALTDGLAIAVFLCDGGGGRSVDFDDLRHVASQTAPRLDGEEYMLHFIHGNDGWTCNDVPVTIRER